MFFHIARLGYLFERGLRAIVRLELENIYSVLPYPLPTKNLGGAGKTAMTAAIAGQFVVNEKKVVMIDTDSQANLSNQFLKTKGLDYELADYLFADKMSKPALLQKTVKKTRYKNLYIMPSKKLSEGGRIDKWARLEAAESENRRAIPTLLAYLSKLGFEYALFDMPPSYSELDKKVILACDEVVPVLRIEKDSVEGLSDFYLLLEELRDGEEKPVVDKLVFNMRNKTQKEQNNLMQEIEKIKTRKFIFPQEQPIETAKKEMRLLQSYRIKRETADLLKELANELM